MIELNDAWVDDWITTCRERCRRSRQHSDRSEWSAYRDEPDEFTGTWEGRGGVLRAT